MSISIFLEKLIEMKFLRFLISNELFDFNFTKLNPRKFKNYISISFLIFFFFFFNYKTNSIEINLSTFEAINMFKREKITKELNCFWFCSYKIVLRNQ